MTLTEMVNKTIFRIENSY